MRQIAHDEEEYRIYILRLQRVAEASRVAAQYGWLPDIEGTLWKSEYLEALDELSKSEQ